MAIRTDLAVESMALRENSTEKTTKLEGVRARSRGDIAEVEVLNEKGARSLGKPIGRYLTMELPKYFSDARADAEKLAEELRNFLRLEKESTVMVIGLGNRAITPDALGPQTVDRLFLTRHLIENLPKQFGACRSVSALTPGVLATTGIETLETVRGAVEHVKPQCVIAIDALAAAQTDRLCRTVQMTDSGIAPGSGVGNRRAALNRRELGVPVFALGVPTVTDASQNAHMIVTPRDIDAQITYLSTVLSGALNLVLHADFDYDDFAQFATFRQ